MNFRSSEVVQTFSLGEKNKTWTYPEVYYSVFTLCPDFSVCRLMLKTKAMEHADKIFCHTIKTAGMMLLNCILDSSKLLIATPLPTLLLQSISIISGVCCVSFTYFSMCVYIAFLTLMKNVSM